MLSAFMASVVMLSVVMLSVEASIYILGYCHFLLRDLFYLKIYPTYKNKLNKFLLNVNIRVCLH